MILRGTHKFDISITSNIATIYYPKIPFDYPFQPNKLDKYPVLYQTEPDSWNLYPFLCETEPNILKCYPFDT